MDSKKQHNFLVTCNFLIQYIKRLTWCKLPLFELWAVCFDYFWTPSKIIIKCSARNVSNVLTEDQCKWLSTKWFIPLKEKTAITHGYYESLLLNYSTTEITIFSLCWPLILLHHVWNGFLFASSHGSPISAGFQLTLFPGTRCARPFSPLPVNHFLEAQDPGNCPLLCWAQSPCLDPEVLRRLLLLLQGYIPSWVFLSLFWALGLRSPCL